MELNLQTVIPFGKYKDRDMETIAYEDPRYIFWLRDKTDHIVSRELVFLADDNDQIKEVDDCEWM